VLIMSWFIFMKFDIKIYVLIMSWFIFIKIDIYICVCVLIYWFILLFPKNMLLNIYSQLIYIISLFTQYSHKNETTSTFNQRLTGACNRSPGSKLLSITLHCGRYLGGRARLPHTILKEDHPMTFPSKFGSNWATGSRQDGFYVNFP
jgi:hypothetical protein